jgi:hypothetical protein
MTIQVSSSKMMQRIQDPTRKRSRVTREASSGWLLVGSRPARGGARKVDSEFSLFLIDTERPEAAASKDSRVGG